MSGVRSESTISLIFVLAAFVLLAVQAAVAAPLNVADYLYATESASALSNATYVVGGETYVLHSLSGSPILLQKGEDFVEVLDDIERVLKHRCFATAYPSDSNLDAVASDLLAFNASRNAQTSIFGGEEEVCKDRTGQDQKPCYDDESCRAACFSQYVCMLIYQAGTLTFLAELVEFGQARAVFDSNMSSAIAALEEMKAVNSADQLTFDVSTKLSTVSSSATTIKTWAEKLESNKLFEEVEGGFNTCPPLGLETAKLTSAITKLGTLSSNAACFGGIDSLAKKIQNESFARTEYYVSTKQKANLQNRFNNLSEQFNTLHGQALNITETFEDENITAYADELTSLGAKFYQDMSAKQYDQAGLDLANYEEKLNGFRSYIDSISIQASALASARDSTSILLRKADILIEPTDTSLYTELQQIEGRFDEAESSLAGERITYEESAAFVESYESIRNETVALLNRKSEFEATRAQSVFAGTARSISLPVLESISGPLGIKEDEKRAWMVNIPLMILIISDVVIIAVALLLFFFLVWRKKDKFLRRKIISTWIAIFAVMILLLGGATWAINSLIAKEAVQASYFSFMSLAKKSGEVRIFSEYSSAETPDELKGCAQKIADAFTALGKNATQTDVVDEVCDSMLLSECLKQVGETPVIRLHYSTTNSTAFYTFYRTEAEMKGELGYFRECMLATLIS